MCVCVCVAVVQGEMFDGTQVWGTSSVLEPEEEPGRDLVYDGARKSGLGAVLGGPACLRPRWS